MAWDDRLQELAYTSPKGRRFTPKYENLENSFDKKTEAVQFATVDRTLIRDYGNTAQTFPLILYFSGPDCDRQAADFKTALRERGFGRLEHPLEGQFYVVPAGKITRRDDLATAANVVALELEFLESNDLAAAQAKAKAAPAANLPTVIASAQVKLAEELEKAAEGGSVTAAANLAADTQKTILDTVNELKSAIAGQVSAVRNEISGRLSDLENNIQTLATTPAALAASVILTTETILTAPERVRARLVGAYRALSGLAGGLFTIATAGPDAAVIFAGRKVQAAALVLGAAEATAAEPWERRADAVAAAREIQAAAALYLAWTETQSAAINVDNATGSDADILEAAALAAGAVIERSFDLTQEYQITTDRRRALVDLVAELYQDLTRIDDFILDNNLSGSEILEIPQGRRIVYYQ
jgi:prophage DNA circulation protein